MNQLLKRIARNGLLAAVILAVLGLGFAEAAALAMSVQAGRGAAGEAETSRSLRARLPLGMAGWGFAFVAVTEVGLYLWRGNRRPAMEEKPIVRQESDPAEVLLEQLLREAEAKQQGSPDATTPSQAADENSSVHQPSASG